MRKAAALDTGVELVDIVDENDRPLLVMPLVEAHRQKRSPKKSLYPGRFDLSATGHVQAGEARIDAAARELYEELGLRAKTLTVVDTVPASQETGYEFVTLFSAGCVSDPPRPNPEEVADGMFVDQAELASLVRRYREMLTPGLVHFFEKKVLFPDIP